MATPGVINTDDVDQRIESRMALLRDSLELGLRRDLDKSMQDRFSNATKAIGTALGATAVLLTGFGIKTMIDVKDIARSTAIDKVKQTLALDDPNSEFRREMDQLISRALIDSYLLTINKNKLSKFSSNITIRDADIDRLMRVIKDPKSTARDFSDALTVIAASDQIDNDSSINELLVQLGNAENPTFAWAKNQDEKRARIFEQIHDDALQNEARQILRSEGIGEILLRAVITYEVNTKDLAAVPLIEALAARSDDSGTAAMVGLARLSPLSKTLSNELGRNLEKGDLTGWGKKLQIVGGLVSGARSSFLESDPNANARTAIAAKVFGAAVESGVYFRRSFGFDDRSLMISLRSNTSRGNGVPAALVSGHALAAIQSFLRGASRDLAGYQRAVTAFCLGKDDVGCGAHVDVTLKGAGALQVGSARLTAADARSIAIQAESAEPSAALRVVWTDSGGVRQSGHLNGVASLQSSDMMLAVGKTIVDDDDDASLSGS